MNGSASAHSEVRLTMSLNDASRHEGAITAYAEVGNYLLRRYATDLFIARADENIRKNKAH